MRVQPQWIDYIVLLRHAYHHVLPSFPTRRSSDLKFNSKLSRNTASSTSPIRPCQAAPAFDTAMSTPPKTRSEEHTSELQSHHDLVCRLLLEKKKMINSTRQSTMATSTTTSAPNTL